MRDRIIDQAFTRESHYGTAGEPAYSGALSFFRRRYSRDLTDVDVAVMGVPLDLATTNRPGARFGPSAIRAASAIMAWSRPYGWGLDPFERLAVVDTGDCPFDSGRPERVPDEIERHARSLLDGGAALLTLGGDHFISYPLLKAHIAKHGAPLSLLHFDAHTDTWADDEEERIEHGTMFFHAARQGLIDPARSVQVGIRTFNADPMGFNILDAPWVHANGIEATVAQIRRILGDNKVYLTFDIDCLDPCFAPGTGTPVCGGLSTAQVLGIFKGLVGIDVIGMDVVEVAPAYDVGQITALAAAAVAAECLCLMAHNKPDR